ncbi:MAG: Macrolide export ATP-binding/permease protein MacB [Bacteroidia bacterium]|nr:Macrolide export ATP-binding/permease protein MacB [Bacteroidia bacterium]
MNSLIRENIKVALQAIRSQLLRTILTVLIIAFGIMALVGILTAIDGIKQSINNNFANMGANTFTIRNRGDMIRIGKNGTKPKKFRTITYNEAQRFCDEFSFPSLPSVSALATQIATIRYENEKTNPNISVFGGDINYLAVSGYELESGRNFSNQEIQSGTSLVILGNEIAKTLFKNTDPLGKIVSIGSNKYKVIGVLKEKGSSMGFGGDKMCIISIGNLRHYYMRPKLSFVISVLANDAQSLDNAVSEATGLFRKIREVKLGEEENFEVVKSDSLSTMLIENISYVTMAATIIGFITLLGAAIGLMNIMLVSVTERTREIGIRKAIGAKAKLIRQQFLIEAIVICQLGGLLGIIFGIAMGNAVSFFVGGGFIIPWLWISGGIILCFIVGVVSGIYPAIKASKLDPIEALRFE